MAKYAARHDLTRLGLSEEALSGVSVARQEVALGSACTIADGFLSEAFVLPLVWTFLVLSSRSADGEGPAIDIFSAPQVSLALDITEVTPDDIEVSHSGTGTSVATVSGTPTLVGEAVIEILSNASDLSPPPSVRYSLDGGDTFSAPLTLDTSGVLELSGTGLSVTFTDASFVDNDLYSFSFGVGLLVSIEHSADGETDWEEVGTFTIPSPLEEGQHLTLELGDNNLDLLRYLRVTWTIVGGSVAFGVSYEGDDLKAAVCAIASLQILKVRGFDPNGPDALWETEDAKARKWLYMVHEGKVSPRWIDQTPETEESKPYIASKKARGWV